MEEQLKKPRNMTSTILLLLSACLVMLIVVAAFIGVGFDRLAQRTAAATWRTPTRMEINEAVMRLILAGRASEVYNFYAVEVGDPVKAALYVQAAIEGTDPAPIDFVMALGYWEGGHQIDKVDGPNMNGSYDVRPMGLNTVTYKKYSLADLKQISVNIPFGVNHLDEVRNRWKLSWEAAAATYNHGTPTGLDQRQIDYVVAVLRHEYELDRRFAARFPEMF